MCNQTLGLSLSSNPIFLLLLSLSSNPIFLLLLSFSSTLSRLKSHFSNRLEHTLKPYFSKNSNIMKPSLFFVSTFHVTISIRGESCLLYTSDAADDMQCVDLGGRRIIKKKTVLTNQRPGSGQMKNSSQI